MRTNGHVLEEAVPESLLDWERTRKGVGRLICRESISTVGITAGAFAALFGIIALVECTLYQALQNGAVSGIGTSVFGFF